MIVLTRLNNKRFTLNTDLIRTIEENPDTTIGLTSGDHVLVRESMDEVIELAIDFYRRVRSPFGAVDC